MLLLGHIKLFSTERDTWFLHFCLIKKIKLQKADDKKREYVPGHPLLQPLNGGQLQSILKEK